MPKYKAKNKLTNSDDTKKHGIRYPWDQWFKKWRFMLVEGKHYDILTYCMRQIIHREAKKRKIMVIVTTKNKDGKDRLYVVQVRMNQLGGKR